MSDVTPIRPGVKMRTPKKRNTRESTSIIKERLHDLQFRVGRASALAKSLALSLDGQPVLAFGLEPTEGCLGVAELLDGIQEEMYMLSQGNVREQ
jgi:hypothetical protein